MHASVAVCTCTCVQAGCRLNSNTGIPVVGVSMLIVCVFRFVVGRLKRITSFGGEGRGKHLWFS